MNNFTVFHNFSHISKWSRRQPFSPSLNDGLSTTVEESEIVILRIVSQAEKESKDRVSID